MMDNHRNRMAVGLAILIVFGFLAPAAATAAPAGPSMEAPSTSDGSCVYTSGPPDPGIWVDPIACMEKVGDP